MYITTIEDLKKRLSLTKDEEDWTESAVSMPVKISEYYLRLINPDDPADPIRRQCVPSAVENVVSERSEAAESMDPLKEVHHSQGVRLIHRYGNRAAFLATDYCASYCRHCFRRRFTKGLLGPAGEDEVRRAAEYLAAHLEIKEMLLTGGDPLTISDEGLSRMIGVFREANPALIIRICTRVPVFEPRRITPALVDVFTRFKTAPFFLMTQFNHPRELTEEAVSAVSLFVDAGIPAFNQSVLLKGVNDNVDTLETLCNKLLFSRIKPYYLFQTDLVYGTESFRVPIERGMEIERELRERLSGLAMPSYTLDLPDGGGKVPLCGNYIDKTEGDICYLHTLSGEKRAYPAK